MQMPEIEPLERHDQPIDVLDSGYKLMVLLREKAPGTYNHSKNVASMLEAIGSELGLDVRSLRIAGYFHDIGKTTFPELFTENQADQNIHDSLNPQISYHLITSHVAWTSDILTNDSNIPREVIQWCSQHHGTTVVRYFFQKDGSRNENKYRYKCTKPNTLEGMLLMLCDHLEARSRSLSQSGKLDQIDDLVEIAFNDLNIDEQFDDVTLKLAHLRLIKKFLCRELSSQYHKRIDYDAAAGSPD